MAIVDEAGRHETLTTGERALDLFTDRVSLIRHFAKLLNEDPASNKILFFEGDGGNGKSLLLRYLTRYYCKWLEPDNWNWVASKSDAEFVEELKLAEGESPVPVGFLDFSFPGRTDSLNALRKLRHDLGEHGIHFPLFDFACFWHSKETGQLTDEQLKSLFPSEELDLIVSITQLFAAIPAIATVKDTAAFAHKRITGRKLDEKIMRWLRSRKLDEDDVRAITTMDPERELIDKLPELFAKDLNAAIALQDWPKRVVLFFDGHEAFWGAERNRRSATYFQRDAWLRCLLRHLELGDGIVAVVAGREFPSWPDRKAKPFQIEEKFIDHQPVGDLCDADARSYLERALAGVNVTDEVFPFLCDYARVGQDRVHPLYLGMCAEIVVAAAKKKRQQISSDDVRFDPDVEDKAKELINRFLSYADDGITYAVPVLSACRSFDRKLYMAVGEALGIQPSRAAFDNLIEFSFVRKEVETKPSIEPRSDGATDASTAGEKESKEEARYRIHDLLRRVFVEQADDLMREANVALEQYHRERAAEGDRKAIAEAIYHVNRLDWERGAREWVEVFEEALSQSNYALCDALLDVKTELITETDFSRALVSQTEGGYLAELARYDAAKQVFSDAIAAYDQALRHAPENARILSNKGVAYQSLGDVQVSLAQHEPAQQSYTDAIAASKQALRHAPNDAQNLNNKGNALVKLGDLQVNLTQFDPAKQSFTQAIAAYDRALHYAPDYVYAYNNKGNALQSLGDLQASHAQHEPAQQSYTNSIAAFNHALHHAPDYVNAYNNKGNSLAKLGNLQAKLAQHEPAKQSFTQAIAAYDQALQRAPEDAYARNNKGIALKFLGDLQVTLAQYELAMQSYTDSITAYDQTLQRAPDDVYAHNNKGIAQWNLGHLHQNTFSDCEGAKQHLQHAVAAFTRSLEIAPGDDRVRNLLETVKTILDNLDC